MCAAASCWSNWSRISFMRFFASATITDDGSSVLYSIHIVPDKFFNHWLTQETNNLSIGGISCNG